LIAVLILVAVGVMKNLCASGSHSWRISTMIIKNNIEEFIKIGPAHYRFLSELHFIRNMEGGSYGTCDIHIVLKQKNNEISSHLVCKFFCFKYEN
jgi:hypothetical protein